MIARVTSRQPRLPLFVSACAALAIGLTGCAQANTRETSSTPPTPSISASDGSIRFAGVTVSGPVGQKPTFLIGDETAGTESFTVYDIVEGSGAQAVKDAKVTVHYVGRSAKTKRQFDSSWDRGTSYSADLSTLVFAAFTEGVPG